MASYNRVIMIGNLTRDPEHKQLSSGQAVCRLGLASNRQFRNRQTGEMVQEVCFVDVDVWGQQAESCNQYLEKGRPVLVEGRLKLDTWMDNDGLRRSKHSIVADRVTFLSSTAQAEGEAQSSHDPQEYSAESVKPVSKAVPKPKRKEKEASSGEVDFKDEAPFEDDLPF